MKVEKKMRDMKLRGIELYKRCKLEAREELDELKEVVDRLREHQEAALAA